MSLRLPLILLGLVVLALGGLLASLLIDGAGTSDGPLLTALGAVDPNKDLKDIDAVELVRTEPGEQRVVFGRGDKDRWEVREPGTGPADGVAVEGVVRDLLRLKPTPFPELTTNPATHGLDKPTFKVTLRRGSKSATLNVGLTTIGKEKAVTFVSTGERPGVPVAVRRSDLDALFRAGSGEGPAWSSAKWVSDYRQKRLLGPDLGDPVNSVQSFSLKQGGKELALDRSANGDWLFKAPANFGVADLAGDSEPRTDTYTGVRPLLGVLTNLSVADANDFIEQPDPLDKYGLNPENPAALRIAVVPKDGPPEVLVVGKAVDEKATPLKYFARREGSSAVVRLQTDRVAALSKVTADPTDLRDRTLVSDLKKEAIDAIDVVAGGNTTKLRKVSQGAAKQWALYGGPADPQFTNPNVQALLDAVTRPRAAREVLNALNDAAFAPNEVKGEVRLWFDGTEPPGPAASPDKLPPEPKLKGDGKPAVTLVFGKKEGDAVFVRRTTADGVKTDLKLPDAVLPVVARGRLDYLDLKLKSFATNAATKIAFNRGAEPFELVKDEKPDPLFPTGKWTYAKPERLKGQTADADRVGFDLLAALVTTVPTRAVSEQPSGDDMKRFGLDPVRLRVTVTLTGEPKEVGYEFGNETEDKQGVYVKEAGKALVLVAPAATANSFLTLDLRDRTLYRLDRTKVQRLTLRGWKQALGSPIEVVLENKGGTWTVAKSPVPLTPDAGKVNQLLAEVVAPRAVGFAVGPVKEQGFDIQQDANALEVKIEVEGQPVTTLTLANETDNGANLFAWASTLKPGEVATLPAGVLKAFKEKPASLQK